MTVLTTETIQFEQLSHAALDRAGVEQRLIELAAFLVDGPPATDVPHHLDPGDDPLWFLADRMVASRTLRHAA